METIVLGLLGLIIIVTMILGYVWHFGWWLSGIKRRGGFGTGNWLLAVVGVLVPPIGIIHGLALALDRYRGRGNASIRG